MCYYIGGVCLPVHCNETISLAEQLLNDVIFSWLHDLKLYSDPWQVADTMATSVELLVIPAK